ncbi:MAG: tRNA (adenosine(37)-N6)-threonylcarbamoyltransferase complex ATPase subunit type 1 TsaE [Merismopedia sp. SIO2A8]|nr:tRNA (adenosine(37)-N6)-threonylcarbamoyltransferase complex ATPase subunit type 1 TsaE [Merismopedia sp. SIO2A8]
MPDAGLPHPESPTTEPSDLTATLPNAEATRALGEHWGRSLPAGTVLLLYGDLGSGKTTLVQGIGKGLGIVDPIVSPTFTLINEYLEGRLPLYHFDLYRLTNADTHGLAPDIYWDSTEYEPGLVVVEWAERLEYYPPQYLKIELSIEPRISGRSIHITPFGLNIFEVLFDGIFSNV